MASLGSFVTGRSEIGQPYMLGGLTGPDPRFEEDLTAVDDYVRTQTRPRVEQFPQSLPFIEDYEKWRQGLGWYDMNVVPNDTWLAAKAKRDAINAAQNNVLPATSVVEEGAFVAAPADPTKETPGLSSLTKFALALGAGIAGVALLAVGVSKVSPSGIAKRLIGKKTTISQGASESSRKGEITS